MNHIKSKHQNRDTSTKIDPEWKVVSAVADEKKVKLAREQLYTVIWEISASGAAKKYGVHYTSLSKSVGKQTSRSRHQATGWNSVLASQLPIFRARTIWMLSCHGKEMANTTFTTGPNFMTRSGPNLSSRLPPNFDAPFLSQRARLNTGNRTPNCPPW